MSSTRHVFALHADGLEIPVTVTRKRVKNLNLRVRADGSVALSIPHQTTEKAVRGFLERKAGWIVEHVRRARERQVDQGAGTEAPGDEPALIPLWGELVPRDTVLPCQRGARLGSESKTERTGREGLADAIRAADDMGAEGHRRQARTSELEMQAAVEELYRAEVRRVLPEVASMVESRIGVHATHWSVRVMKTRWGSCTPQTGAIRINARLAAYPPECLEFVIAHELVHLLEPSHNERFHALLDSVCPRNRELASTLKRRAGASVPNAAPHPPAR